MCKQKQPFSVASESNMSGIVDFLQGAMKLVRPTVKSPGGPAVQVCQRQGPTEKGHRQVKW